MQAHWSREDLPHWDKIRDADDMAGNGLRSRVIDIALDEVVDHLNANHPKSDDVRRVEAQRDTQKTKARRARRARDKWQAACETPAANAQMWMDEAVTQRDLANALREFANSMEQRAEAAGRELAAANDELSRLRDSLGEWDGGAARQQMQAWGRLAEHPFFADCYKADGSLIDAMIAKLDAHILFPDTGNVVSREQLEEDMGLWAVRHQLNVSGRVIREFARVAHASMASRSQSADVAEVDPVEDKARELYEAGHPEGIEDVAHWTNLAPGGKDMYRRIARHILGADDE